LSALFEAQSQAIVKATGSKIGKGKAKAKDGSGDHTADEKEGFEAMLGRLQDGGETLLGAFIRKRVETRFSKSRNCAAQQQVMARLLETTSHMIASLLVQRLLSPETLLLSVAASFLAALADSDKQIWARPKLEKIDPARDSIGAYCD
jgi:hypothetical protein